MNIPTLIYYIMILGIFVFLSKVIYYICLANFIRSIVGVIFILVSLAFALNGEWQEAGVFFGLSIEFMRKFYLYTNTYEFRNDKQHINNVIGIILKPIALFLHLGTKAGQYAVSVVDGTVSAKKELKKEKAEFENEKQSFEAKKREYEEEWENIKKAWDELIREREEFERQKAGESSGKKKDYSKSEGYQKSKAKSQKSGQTKSKQKTGRFFKEFAKFDLDNPSKNNASEILGVDKNASRKEILMAYKKLMMKFHPDKFASESLDKVKEANRIAVLLNSARERLV